MADVQPYINDTLDFARTGFATVNVALGLIIAVIAAFMTTNYKQLFVITLGATLLTIVAEALLPVVAKTGDLRMPQVLNEPFWYHVGYLLVGYLVLIAVLFTLRRALLKGGH